MAQQFSSSAPLRVGILGAAKIAPAALIEPARSMPEVQVAAVAARDLSRAQAYATTNGIPAAYDSYEALLARPDIDAIYNALPPARHADLTIAALRAGKHVLCEKPFAMNAVEARAMVDAGTQSGRVLMEAFHYRYHPLFGALLDTVRSGQLGRLESIAATFVVPIAERDGELRFDAALGGGCLMDMGTYCVHWCRTVAGREPGVSAAAMRMGATGVDLHTTATLDFGAGLTASIDCGMDAPFTARLEIVGSAGRLTANNPLAPQFGNQVRLEVNGEPVVTREYERTPTYAFQLAAFVAAVRRGELPVTAGEDCVAQMAVLDAIARTTRRS